MEKDKKNFILLINELFGYGYGSGDEHTLKVLKDFLQCCDLSGDYGYLALEDKLTKTVCWLLINILCKNNILEYGISPRYSWLTDKGKELKLFIEKYSVDELVDITNISEEESYEIYGKES